MWRTRHDTLDLFRAGRLAFASIFERSQFTTGEVPSMIRSVFASLAAFVAITAVSAQGCKASGVGDPCIPEKEFDPTFLGFDKGEVNVESKSFQCLTRLCLVNHFRGRVTCPYGQDKTAASLPTVDG